MTMTNPAITAHRNAAELVAARMAATLAPVDPRIGPFPTSLIDRYGPLKTPASHLLTHALQERNGDLPGLFIDLIHMTDDTSDAPAWGRLLVDTLRAPWRLASPSVPVTADTGYVTIGLHSHHVRADLHTYSHQLHGAIEDGVFTWDPDRQILTITDALMGDPD